MNALKIIPYVHTTAKILQVPTLAPVQSDSLLAAMNVRT